MKYQNDFDSLIRDDEFLSLYSYTKPIQMLFRKLKFSDFNKSLYDVFVKLNDIQRNSYLNALKTAIENSKASEDFKKKASLLDNFKTPPKC